MRTYFIFYIDEYFFFFIDSYSKCVNTNKQTLLLVTFIELDGLTDQIHYNIHVL